MLNRNFFYALSTLVGMIVGVGIFGIPYCFAQAGIMTGFFYLGVLGAMALLIHLFYGEIVLRTEGDHRLVGFAEKYLGRAGKRITGAVIIFEFYGAMLAYLIVAGQFLNLLLGRFFGGGDFSWTIVFFILGAAAIFFGLKTIGVIEFLMTFLLIIVAGIFIYQGGIRTDLIDFTTVNWANFFLPYGVILFALTGGAAVPEMRHMLKGQEKKLKTAIIIGTLIPVLIYAVFALSVVGVSGGQTTKNAIEGMIPFLGEKIVIIGAVFGFLAVITSFLVVGLNLRQIFHCDYKIKKKLAWFLACFVPLAGFIFGLNNFIAVIGFIGAIAGGLEGILLILIYLKAKRTGRPAYSLRLPAFVPWLMMATFALGIIYHFIYLAE
ncbi:MAG: aromatic amino acid transport family protein [Candidatus Portnoybacteria bacterium]|nr:aromatic amino acid transport family protein [Candidatus Portnoybacteria bacterium]